MTIALDGAASRHFSLDDRYRDGSGLVYLTGIQAIVRLLLEQRRYDRASGLDTRAFISGYEGSPLAGLDLELGRRRSLLDEHGIVFTPGLNEEAAAMAVQGTQLTSVAGRARHDGVAGFWYGKAPGLDRASDALRHANLMGTHHLGGALAMVGDDPAAKSSSVPSASEPTLADLAIPVLYPADPAEIVRLGLHGIALSRAAGLWAAGHGLTCSGMRRFAGSSERCQLSTGRSSTSNSRAWGRRRWSGRSRSRACQTWSGGTSRSSSIPLTPTTSDCSNCGTPRHCGYALGYLAVVVRRLAEERYISQPCAERRGLRGAERAEQVPLGPQRPSG